MISVASPELTRSVSDVFIYTQYVAVMYMTSISGDIMGDIMGDIRH